MADNRRLEDLKRRVQQDPASIAFAALADEYRRLELFHDAIETCRAGLLRHPAYLSARVTLGRALVAIGEYDEAEAQLEQVVRVAPDNLAAIRALADIHHKRGDSPEAYGAHAELASTAQPAPAPEPASPSADAPPPETPDPPRPAAVPVPVQTQGRQPAAEPPKRIPVVTAPALQVESHMAAPEPVAPAPLHKPAEVVARSAGQTAAPAAYVPPVDPVCERLEQFLAAIERARDGVQAAGAHGGR